MAPLPPVVRSTVGSWHTTSSPSAVAWTSSSRAEAPPARARRMAQRVLEGPSRAPPWWAKARTRRSSQGVGPTGQTVPWAPDGPTPAGGPRRPLPLQRRVARPDPRLALGLLPPEIHALGLGCDSLERADPTVEQVYSTPPDASECSLEVTYDGALRLDEPVLESPEAMQACFAPLARWVASTLVRLGDLPLEFLPEEESEAEASD